MQVTTEDKQVQLVNEWHPKNEKKLTDYSKANSFKAWWKCHVCNHEWQATIANRRRNASGCPKCWNLKKRGNTNSQWKGYGEISGRYWNNILKEGKKLQFEFSITIEYAWELFLKQNKKCALSGEPLTMCGKIDGKYVGNSSLNRIDFNKGYTKGNVQWIDKKLQLIKRNLPDPEFIAICQKVSAYQIEKLGIPSFKKWKSKTKSSVAIL
jgi:hypothetical protein